MASLENLPPDQRAVLQMVLARGRGYDEIAKMLQIDRADVRQRALQALDALGPATRVPSEGRALITDYLLGQLPPRVSDDVREQLARSPSERAWARVVASELESLAAEPLPEIPAAAVDADTRIVPAAEPEAAVPAAAAPAPSQPGPPAPAVSEPEPPASRERGPRTIYQPTSRRGGAILLGLVGAVVIAVVVFLIVNSGGSSHKSPSASPATSASTTPAATSTTACNPATSTTACPIKQINLRSPTKSSTLGIAEVLKKQSTMAIAIVAQGVPANTKHNAYAVWLANSPTDSRAVRLGFVNPGVGKNGRLQTAGPLPTNASSFKQLLVTLETKPTPKQPGPVVLQGSFSEG